MFGFRALKPSPSVSLRNSTQEWWSNFYSSPKLKNSIFHQGGILGGLAGVLGS